MAHSSPSNSSKPVPVEMIAQHQAGWYAFTRAIVGVSAATAALLLVLLLFFKIF